MEMEIKKEDLLKEVAQLMEAKARTEETFHQIIGQISYINRLLKKFEETPPKKK
jgi:hypothetical protein